MERKLSSMFEFQRFAQNPRLSKLIAETESRCSNALGDDDLWIVNAAGSPEETERKMKEKFGGKVNG